MRKNKECQREDRVSSWGNKTSRASTPASGVGWLTLFLLQNFLVAKWLKGSHFLFLCLFLWEVQFLFEAFKEWALFQWSKNGRKKRQKTQRKIISTRMLWIISNLGLFSNCLKQSVFQMCCELQAWFAPDIWILPGTTLFVIFLSSDLRVQPHSHSSFLYKVKDTVVGTGFQSKKEY